MMILQIVDLMNALFLKICIKIYNFEDNGILLILVLLGMFILADYRGSHNLKIGSSSF